MVHKRQTLQLSVLLGTPTGRGASSKGLGWESEEIELGSPVLPNGLLLPSTRQHS